MEDVEENFVDTDLLGIRTEVWIHIIFPYLGFEDISVLFSVSQAFYILSCMGLKQRRVKSNEILRIVFSKEPSEEFLESLFRSRCFGVDEAGHFMRYCVRMGYFQMIDYLVKTFPLCSLKEWGMDILDILMKCFNNSDEEDLKHGYLTLLEKYKKDIDFEEFKTVEGFEIFCYSVESRNFWNETLKILGKKTIDYSNLKKFERFFSLALKYGYRNTIKFFIDNTVSEKERCETIKKSINKVEESMKTLVNFYRAFSVSPTPQQRDTFELLISMLQTDDLKVFFQKAIKVKSYFRVLSTIRVCRRHGPTSEKMKLICPMNIDIDESFFSKPFFNVSCYYQYPIGYGFSQIGFGRRRAHNDSEIRKVFSLSYNNGDMFEIIDERDLLLEYLLQYSKKDPETLLTIFTRSCENGSYKLVKRIVDFEKKEKSRKFITDLDVFSTLLSKIGTFSLPFELVHGFPGVLNKLMPSHADDYFKILSTLCEHINLFLSEEYILEFEKTLRSEDCVICQTHLNILVFLGSKKWEKKEEVERMGRHVSLFTLNKNIEVLKKIEKEFSVLIGWSEEEIEDILKKHISLLNEKGMEKKLDEMKIENIPPKRKKKRYRKWR